MVNACGVWLLWAVLASAFARYGGQPPPVQEPSGTEPRILAIVVGVTQYGGAPPQPDDPILLCAQNAKEVAAAVERTFPGVKPIVMTSAAADPAMQPTYANIRALLNTEVPRLPPSSYVIFYFAGHGVRVGDPTRDGLTELGLVLQGGVPSSERPDFANTMLYSELLAPFRRMRLGNFLLLLDCCHAGAEVTPIEDAVRLEHKLLNLRGVAISASTRSQKTYKDAFTKALTQYWTQGSGPCETPDVMRGSLARMLQTVVADMLQMQVDDTMLRPSLLLGKGAQVCIGTFGQPSTLLFIVPPRSTNLPMIQIGDAPAVEFNPQADVIDREAGFYIRQVPRTSTRVVCTVDGFGTRTVNLTDTQLSREVLWVDFRQEPGKELDRNAAVVATGPAASDAAWELGARDSSAYDLELAYLALATDDELRSRIMRPYDDARARVVASAADSADLDAVAAGKDALRVAAVLARSGKSLEALNLATRTRGEPSWFDNLNAVAMHEYANLRLLGQDLSAERIAPLLEPKIHSNLRTLSEEQIRESLRVLPVDKAQLGTPRDW
ncbi:MAG: caspase family protein [Phycisphaeraceae bacterium]|nr:caspase family protein [Phycisphaeraceae bacterium]MBX3366199.1 caspase family protein [Phycisphaeraceae bacterium]